MLYLYIFVFGLKLYDDYYDGQAKSCEDFVCLDAVNSVVDRVS